MNDDVVAALHPVRLPQAFTQTGLADGLLAFGLGLLASVLILMLLAPLMRGKPRRQNWKSAVKIAQGLPPELALPRLAKLAQQRGVELSQSERDALYRQPTLQAVQSLATRLVTKGGRR